MLARWLDEELARGMGASLSEAHAARAEQLTGETRGEGWRAHSTDWSIAYRIRGPRL